MLQRNNGDVAMAKTYKVLVNDGKGAESVAVQVAQGAGDKGTPVRLLAQRGVRYELQDVTKGKGVAPDQVRAKRVGNNLALMFDGSQNPDVVIEDYYIVKGEGAAPMLAGLAENGGVYEYIPQDPNANHLTPSLKDGNTPVLMALGGGALGEAFVLSALPIVAAAAGGISGWAIAAGVVGAAALGGGGGGGGTPPTDTTPPAPFIANLKHDALNDTGVNSDDSVTTNVTPVLQINAETGAKVDVAINGKTYAATETDTKGMYEVRVTDALPDGTYAPVVRVTDAAGNTTVNGVFVGFTVDTSTTKNLRNGSDDDLNNGVDTTVTISAVTEDTGTVNNDFVTSAHNVKISGTVSQFYTTGVSADDNVQVQIFNSKGELISQEYVTPSSSGTWTMATPTSTLIDGTYTVKAAIVDAAGNVLKTAADQPLVISETYYKAVNDVATAQEDVIATHDATKNNVLLNDSDVVGIRAVVTQVQVKSGTTTQTVAQGTDHTNGTELVGLYGKLKMGADGSYLYTVNSDNAQVQALAANSELKETFTYSATNSKYKSSTADLVVTIKGTNDAAKILQDTGTYVIAKDDDTGEQKFVQTDDPLNQYRGQHGYFIYKNLTVTGNEFKGEVERHDDTNSTLSDDISESHDLFTLTSMDGRAFHTFDSSLKNRNATGAIQEYFGVFNNEDTWKIEAETEIYLISGLYRLRSIEKIDISDTTIVGSPAPAPDTIKLNLLSITQADADGSIHKLYITGDNGDVVELTKPTPTWDEAAHLSTRVVSDVTYNVYQLDSTHELLINNAITTLTVS
jgi:VCBS repeat-containing protein